MMRRLAPLLPVVALSLLIGCPIASAQAPAASPSGATNSKAPDMAGRVISRRTLADCKRQAKARKLSYLQRRKFLRSCVVG
jgi:hypothetical protein